MSKEHTIRDGIDGKVCTKCGEWKPLAEYYKHNITTDGLSYQCHGCRIITNRLHRKRWIRKRVLRLRLLAGGKCEDCGGNRPWLLVFHHRDPQKKLFEITTRTVSCHSWEKLVAEIEKCVLLCPNCHKIRHTSDEQMSQWRALIEEIEKE